MTHIPTPEYDAYIASTLEVKDEWCVLALESYDGDGPIWRILSAFDDAEECMIALSKARTEGFTARMIYAPILKPFAWPGTMA